MKSQWLTIPASSTTLRSCIWPHWPRAFGLRSAVTSAPVSVRSRSSRLAQVAQLGVEPPARLVPLVVERLELRVDPPELLLQRRDEPLDRLLALVEVPPGLESGRCAAAGCAITVSCVIDDCSASALSALNDADRRS